MARGNKNHGRGGFRGGHGENEYRGRGRGARRGERGNSRGRGRGGYMPDEFDYPIQQWPSNYPPATPPPRGFARGRGRGRGWNPIPFTTFDIPVRRGFGFQRGRGRGGDNDRQSPPHGNARNLDLKLRAGAPLSRLLYEDRPLLRPVVFVRSVHTATLFQNEEDIFQPIVEAAVDEDEQSHVPTADAVSRVFKNTDDAEQSDEEEERLEEIDFADVGRIQAEVDATAATQAVVVSSSIKESTSFFVDTTASSGRALESERIEVDRLEGVLGENTLDDDEEIIVYVAPNPRNGKATPAPTSAPTVHVSPSSRSIITGVERGDSLRKPPDLVDKPPVTEIFSQGENEDPSPAFSIELGTLYPELPQAAPSQTSPDAAQLPPPPSFDTITFSFNKTTVKKQMRRLHPTGTPRALLKRMRKSRRKPLRGFGSYGARHEEAMLHKEDPRRDEQRHGDSDVNWGTTDGEDDIDALSVDMGGMELDESISLEAMASFVKSMSAEGSRHVTMDDIADIEQMRKEDEEANVRGAESASDAEVARGAEEDGGSESNDEDEGIEEVIRAEEEVLVGETDGHVHSTEEGDGMEAHDGESGDDVDDEEDDEDDDFEDEEETPGRGFQARLERLRNRSGKGKGKATADDDSSDEAMSINLTWADDDEEHIAHMQRTLSSGSRRERKYMFKAIQNGDFDDVDMLEGMMQPARRGKNKDVPPELAEQWEKDRRKKAENKEKRALERIFLAADPMATHKGGKKGRKAMLAAVRSAEDLPNRVVNLVTVEQQIRRFLTDIGGRTTMALPPTDKPTRKRIHELADAFNLKSQSKGSGNARYTTLIKTTKSGIRINERKVARIMKQETGSWTGPGAGDRGKVNLAKHREGEEVGKDAAKIDNKNIGFRMLAAMGWSDGDHIGLSGGLNAPLTAIMKKTKLGLGATL